MTTKTFNELELAPEVLTALTELGYEAPTPVQEKAIPILLEGGDLLAQAQTGTGKTAAFALPALTDIDVAINQPQVLVIAPTRELVIQVAEAFQSYAKHLPGFHVMPIYGGQEYRIQLRALKRGVQVIVGTPGRVMDHLRRGTIEVDAIKTVVLDEADEMLKMGFVDDVEWILEQIPHEHQTALFSATMPDSIQKIAKRYLTNAAKVKIKPKEGSIAAIEQSYIRVHKENKLEVLTRYLEVEEVQAAIIFSRTKNGTVELAEKLQARGLRVDALNGDMKQSLREKVIGRLRKGSLDIVIATDVAARGIDVERVSHVINYDIPSDVESYVHRIGRTGRAGRTGKALLFVTPREQRLLKAIERAVHQPIELAEPPSLAQMSAKRSEQLANKVSMLLGERKKLKPYFGLVERILAVTDCDWDELAAALACLLQESKPLPDKDIKTVKFEKSEKSKPSRSKSGGFKHRSQKESRGKKSRASSKPAKAKSFAKKKSRSIAPPKRAKKKF